MSALSDENLLRHVAWPWRPQHRMTPARIRETLDRVRRFIDFDQTIAHHVRHPTLDLYRLELYPEILGVPTLEFLAEEPYIIQSWALCDWDDFLWELCVEEHPSLPIPEMVIHPPSYEIAPELCGEFDHGKDFTPFGVRNKLIIDDLMPSEIRAPGCLHLQPR